MTEQLSTLHRGQLKVSAFSERGLCTQDSKGRVCTPDLSFANQVVLQDGFSGKQNLGQRERSRAFDGMCFWNQLLWMQGEEAGLGREER